MPVFGFSSAEALELREGSVLEVLLSDVSTLALSRFVPEMSRLGSVMMHIVSEASLLMPLMFAWR